MAQEKNFKYNISKTPIFLVPTKSRGFFNLKKLFNNLANPRPS